MERRSDRELSELHDALIPGIPSAWQGHRFLMHVWRVRPEALTCRVWDDELVVHNDATGDTHHLAWLGAAILQALLEQPVGLQVSELASSVQRAAVSRDARATPPEIERTLNELADLELVSCVPL
jgi:PqqD family protein of HPr-rel-A system